jgi:gluconate 2-dehydrogenase gamma chain
MRPREKNAPRISRRTVLASATLVPVAALTAKAQAPQTALSVPQRQLLDAFVDRLVPKDELGPGALEMGVAQYIDRALADALAAEKATFTDGLAATDAFARKQFDAPFHMLSGEKQDQVLTALESGQAPDFPNARAFFARVRRLILEGMFGDPYYGGNRNFAGWDLIRYPGPRLAVGVEDQKMSAAPKPMRQSAYGSKFDHGH